ncbi:hypothetical protein Ahy_A09g043456 isoform F [Arachis hypogaea]|uniref:Lipoxygenase domain-containing protein n=1 Tax=Arachis hypogaea TaxID=3818 RepID=A0A445BI96_ARAHY|nr:hypothetical protein Ahy_A09g043456 isoform F [Arachis hypogaea]
MKLLLEQNELHVARILVYEGCEREVVEAGKQSDEFLQYKPSAESSSYCSWKLEALREAAHKAGKQTQDGRDEEITVLRVKIQNLKDDAAAANKKRMFVAEKSKELAIFQGQNKAFKGMAVEDSSSPYGIHLVIEDYPYAVDGLEIWFAIKEWVQDCVSLYYPTDNDLKRDPELQNWWKEAVEVGHGDLKDKPWWPKMQTVEELVESCTTIIWTASALHAAVNFGQYPCGGLILNRPTLSIRLLPEQGTAEYEEMVKSHQKAYLITITPKLETLIDFTTIEILSKHASDEVYLRERDNPHWTFGSRALQPF